MKKIILLFLIALLATTAIGQSYYFLINQSETNRYIVRTQNPFENIAVPYEVRLTDFQANIQTETTNTVILKPSWVFVAQNVYTNGLTIIGMDGVWTNMDYTFETVGAYILQSITAELINGDNDRANLLSTWKGLIKDAYESLYSYGSNYGVKDMRLFPYDSQYIYDKTNIINYIEYNGLKYILGE